MSFLPMIASTSWFVNQAVASQPIINHLSDGELEHLDKVREKELNRRRKRNTRGHGGIALPDCEPLRTHRMNGIPEVDPTTLTLAAAAAAPTAKHAAVAAASLTITNMITSENGTTVIMPTQPVAPQAPSLPTSKIPKAKGLFKPPSRSLSVLRACANPSTAPSNMAADASKLKPPLEGDAPLPVPDSKISKMMMVRRYRDLEKEAKD
jgi:SWI/SNF-related matrix-associated actin-dependent regulator of chromatin subfamily B protein 1